MYVQRWSRCGQGRGGARNPHNTLMFWSNRWPLFTLSVDFAVALARARHEYFAFVLRSTFLCVAFKLLGKCCKPERDWECEVSEIRLECVVPKMLMQFIGEIKNGGGAGKCKWKLCQRFADASFALGHAICKGFPSGQCCLWLVPRSPLFLTLLPTLRPKLMPLVKFSLWLPIAENQTRLGRLGRQARGWQTTSCQVISINVETVKCSKSIKRRPKYSK